MLELQVIHVLLLPISSTSEFYCILTIRICFPSYFEYAISLSSYPSRVQLINLMGDAFISNEWYLASCFQNSLPLAFDNLIMM
jgi:hypothetical protein